MGFVKWLAVLPFLGMLVGVPATTLTHASMASLFPGLPDALRDLNIGIVAMILNVVALGVVSALTRRQVAHA